MKLVFDQFKCVLLIAPQVKRHKHDLANNFNQDIERLKFEQESLKAQIEDELEKLIALKIKNGSVS